MPRYKLTLEYDGKPYRGFQRQEELPTVQKALESALKAYCQQDIMVFVSGRTDAGVHALGQVIHVNFEESRDPSVIEQALNFYLREWEEQVVVLSVEEVADDFHARFSAKGRHYLYRIINRRPQTVLEAGRAWHVFKPLDVTKMQAAAQILVGHHDFTSFRASECQAKSPWRTLDELTVSRHGELIEVTTRSRAFLHHQVRNMVGALKLVGQGRWTTQDLQKALEARDRKAGGPTAPAEGLYFVKVDY